MLKPDKWLNYNIESNLELKNGMNITNRLHSLQLCYISFGDLLTFLSSIYMPLLEKLTLIEVYDDTLNHLTQFQQYFQSRTRMPALRPSALQFLFRFPDTDLLNFDVNEDDKSIPDDDPEQQVHQSPEQLAKMEPLSDQEGEDGEQLSKEEQQQVTTDMIEKWVNQLQGKDFHCTL
ncbi:unnamed protein product [Rotaria sordida]|uniref:Uncharacterized protein n=1 Tax=Rotaria sordida TaxID=392033 RepID=A0A816CPN3_9BILA|nr:unnamed protein product [Rotaria sordida]